MTDHSYGLSIAGGMSMTEAAAQRLAMVVQGRRVGQGHEVEMGDVVELGDELENVRFSLIAAKAVQAAMSVAKAEMPAASERTRLLTVLTGMAASAGILRIDFDDVMNLVSGAYKLGEQDPLDKRLRHRSALARYLRAAGQTTVGVGQGGN